MLISKKLKLKGSITAFKKYNINPIKTKPKLLNLNKLLSLLKKASPTTKAIPKNPKPKLIALSNVGKVISLF